MGTKTPFCPQQPRNNKPPNDGPGPRGFPDCYYMSRTMDSTFRYVRFIKKLRMIEEEQRKGRENNLKALRDTQISDFFNRNDRRSLINNVARRVDLCMRSYENDLEEKKKRLKCIFEREERENIRKVVIQAQEAHETIWQEKLARLKYLLEKRRLEHEQKYKKRPLSKCTHIQHCIVDLRNKEAREFQQYQMREKEAMKMQERELDKMWYELGMKESDALAARMEIDAIEQLRRDMDCKQHSDMILKQRERQRQIDRENLKREQLAMKEKYEADMRKEAEEEAARLAKRLETGEERKQAIADRDVLLAKQAETAKITENVWKSLSGQGMAADQAKLDLMRRKEKELDECNRKMAELRKEIEKKMYDDELMDAAVKDQQAAFDKKKCEEKQKNVNTKYLEKKLYDDELMDAAVKDQQAAFDKKKCEEKQKNVNTKSAQQDLQDLIAERKKEREEVKKRLALEDEYFKQLHDQMEQLVGNKAAEEARDRKIHQEDILKQIQYNKTLKMRELQEELEQRRKAVQAAKEYEEEMADMLCRTSFCDRTHPFIAQMNKVTMRDTCPCSKQTWCKK